jgi:hypothetical protein
MADYYDPYLWWGRCRSGKRWFWAVQEITATDEVSSWHGWTDTEEEAEAAARDAAAQLAGDRPVTLRTYHRIADSVLKRINVEKRRNRPPSEDTDASPVEYLYGIAYADGKSWVKAYRITRKTPKRIYYIREQRFADEDPEIGFVNRQELESTGEVINRSRGWWDADFHLYAEPPELHDSSSVMPKTLSELRAEMADAHPDRGGTREAFEAARVRYLAAKGRVQ